jgi:hypothetical protein
MINEINYSSGDDDVEYNLRSKYCVYSCNQRPEKVCFNGKCIIYVKKGEYDDSGYTSDVLTNPTYKDIFLLCDQIVESTQDFEHVFFEFVSYSKQINEQIHELDVFLGS